MRILMATAMVLTAACGGSPTQPDSVPTKPETPVVTATVVPEPAPQVEPVPVPAPPVTPVPAPAPTWTASTTSAHWYGPALVPATFAVEWRYTTLWFGSLVADIQVQDGRSIFAKGADFTIQIVIDGNTASWTLNGLDGQASGTALLQ